MSNTKKLRGLLRSKPLVVAMGAFDGLSAKLVAETSFDAVYVGGHSVAATYGFPDVGLTTASEVLQRAEVIVDSVEMPVIIDADTGYGGIVNARRFVRQCEKAGVAGFHIEDQEFPKKCGSYRGISLVSDSEMVGKLQAVLDARTDPDFLVIARTDAVGAEGVERAIERGQAYAAAGADAVMVMGARGFSPAKMRQFAQSIDVPTVWIWAESQHWVRNEPILSLDQVQQLGFRMCVSPLAALYAAAKAMRHVLAEIERAGTSEHVLDQLLDFEEVGRIVGLPAVYELEERFADKAEVVR